MSLSDKERAYGKAFRDRRKAAGLCVACGLENKTMHSRCEDCHEDFTNYVSARASREILERKVRA